MKINFFAVGYFLHVALVGVSQGPLFWVNLLMGFSYFGTYIFFKHLDTHLESWENWLNKANFNDLIAVRYMGNYFQGKE